MKKVLIILIAVISVGLFSFLLFRKNTELHITNFEECAKKYPVMESYPSVCATPDGKRFIDNIGNELALIDSISVSSPRPGYKIDSPVIMQGEARGKWFFEGQMNVEVRDAAGKTLGKGLVTADSDWMTEEFVPFSGILNYSGGVSGKKGEVVFKNANPSGIEENSQELIIPITF